MPGGGAITASVPVALTEPKALRRVTESGPEAASCAFARCRGALVWPARFTLLDFH